MFLSNHLTILLLLVSCFPLLLQCWNMKLNPKETIRPYVDEEKNEKVADRQREIDYAQRHRFGNHRYTLTVYNPGYPRLHGLIVSHHNGLVTGFPDVEVKCPKKKLFSPCPRSNHTRTVFHGKLRPVSWKVSSSSLFSFLPLFRHPFPPSFLFRSRKLI